MYIDQTMLRKLIIRKDFAQPSQYLGFQVLRWHGDINGRGELSQNPLKSASRLHVIYHWKNKLLQSMSYLKQRVVLFVASIGSMLAGANAVHAALKPNTAIPKLGQETR